jgi:NAD(P)H-hydrate epimerase
MEFQTDQGLAVPSVTAGQMREIDRIAMEDLNLGILQMMENAGRNLAQNAMDRLHAGESRQASGITVLAGAGGNGGGGLCCARHLHNRGFRIHLVLDREPNTLRGAAGRQLQILRAAGLQPAEPADAQEAIRGAKLVVDALIGYSLRGEPRGRAAELIDLCNRHASQVLSLDVPSGLDATTGETPGQAIQPGRTLTLALPKTGLHGISGELYLADIGIPPEVYEQLGLVYLSPFKENYWIRLRSVAS